MAGTGAIDITFDFRTDTPPGKDPDALSPTLRRYHKLLWSKPLPSGVPFALSDTSPGDYLHHRSELGEFFLASDAVVPSFTREVKLSEIIAQVPQAQHDEFNRIGYTIGGMMIWPGRRVDRKMTINGRRGFHPRIKETASTSQSSASAATIAASPARSTRRSTGTRTSSRASETSAGSRTSSSSRTW